VAASADLAHADLSDAGVASCQRLLDRTDHDDVGGPVRQRYGGCRERPEYVNHRHRAGCPHRSFEEALDQDFHPTL
jgi:hypothetical protein